LGKAYTYLRMWKLAALGLVGAQSQCVVDVDNLHFDFGSLAAKQVTFFSQEQNLNYTFTFCASNPCGDQQSSLCQLGLGGDQNNLGVWSSADNWKGDTNTVSGQIYGDPKWCDAPRTTIVTFKCVTGGLRFVYIQEVAVCKYEASIEVPLAVCLAASPCCTTPTYASTRLESDGTTAVVQADAASGNWFDSDFEGKGQGLLCSRSYGRCFTFTDTNCVTSDYRPAPSQCFGSTPDWTFVKQGPVVFNAGVLQTAWRSRADGSYVVTTPLGGSGQCVVVSGNKVDTSFEFSLVPNSTFWSIPKSCIKNY